MRSEADIKSGKWKEIDGEVITVIGVALHTTGDYKVVVFHPESNATELRVIPISAFLEQVFRNGSQTNRFSRLEQ